MFPTLEPRAVLFDLLTALLDSWTLWDRVAGGEEAGRRWRAHYLEITYGCGAYRPYEALVAEAAAAAGLPPTMPERLHTEWGRLEPWPEVPAVLAGLRVRGLRLGVVTNCSMTGGRHAAERCGVPFDVVMTAEEAGFYKPRPETYRAALAALGLPPEQVLFVAGSSADVPGAAGAGMPVVWHNRVGLAARPGAVPLHEARRLDEVIATALPR